MLLNTCRLLPIHGEVARRAGGAGRMAVALVVAEEDVLEAGFVAGQRDDRKLRRGLDHSVRGALHGEAHGGPAVEALDLSDAVELGERVGGERRGEGGPRLSLDSLFPFFPRPFAGRLCNPAGSDGPARVL